MITAICADLHLNNSNFGRMDKHGLSFRTRDFMAAFEFFVEQCVNVVKPQRVVILGDIYDNPNPPNPVRRFFNKMVKRLSKAGISVEIIVGNHDACYFSHALQPVEEANFQGVRVHQQLSLSAADDCLMIMLPHSQEVERRELTHKMAIGEFYAKHQVEIAKARVEGLPVVAFGHFGVYGVYMNDGIKNHNQDDVSLDDLTSLDADAIFLGHYHMDQPLDIPGTKSMYVGSLERSTFNDTAQIKSFVVMETERGKKPVIRRVEYPNARKMITVSGNADQIVNEIAKIKQSISNEESEPIVKVKFEGTVAEYASFCKNKKLIRDELTTAKHIAFEKDVSDPDRDAQAESVRQKIAGKADVGSADILDVFDSWAKTAVADPVDQKAVLGIAADIVSSVDDNDKHSRGIMPGRTRIHGIKLHNFQMYGVDKNVVELDPGAGSFLGRSWGRGEDWSIVSEEARAFLSSLSEDERKLISIVGKIDGDENNSNGSGKTSLLDSISWAFYEKIVRDFYDKPDAKGTSTLSVVRTINDKPERECYVEVLFSAGKNLYLVHRERRVSSSGDHSGICQLWCLYSPEGESAIGSLSGKRGSDAETWMSQLVSMDFDTFSNSVMFGQSDADKFIRGTDKTKKDIFIKILGLGVMDDYLKETRARKSIIDKELASFEAQSQALSSNSMTTDQVAAAQARVDSLKSDSDAKKTEISNLELEIQQWRSNEVFTDKSNCESEIQVLKATIKQKTDEANRMAKTTHDAILQEHKTLAEHHRILKASQDTLDAAKKTCVQCENEVASFNESAAQKDIKLGNDAKIAKPKRDQELLALQVKRETILSEVAACRGRLEPAIADRNKFLSATETMSKSGSSKCPECESIVSSEHIHKKTDEKNQLVALLTEEMKKAADKLPELDAAIDEVRKRLCNIDAYSSKGEQASRKMIQHEANKQSIAQAKRRVAETESRLIEVQKLCDDSTKRLADLNANAKAFSDEAEKDTEVHRNNLAFLEKRLNSVILPRKIEVEKTIGQRDSAIKALRICVGDIDSEVSSLLTRIEVSRKTTEKVSNLRSIMSDKQTEQIRLGIVENGFGLDGIRVQIIEKYVPLCNVYVGEFMDVLSDKMSAAVVTDGKRDGKMEIKINGSSASNPRQLSKGQFAKLKVAMDLALGMMSLARNENAPDFVCLDEVFAPVDVAGKQAMFDVIAKLQEYFRMVMVISHDPSVQETIKDVIVVNQVNDISTIEKQAHEHM